MGASIQSRIDPETLFLTPSGFQPDVIATAIEPKAKIYHLFARRKDLALGTAPLLTKTYNPGPRVLIDFS